MALRIITDSASDLPKDIAKKFDVEVIPTPVTIEEIDYLDGETIQPMEFYNLLRDNVNIKTYHINSFMFKEHFEKYAKNKDSLIYICFSTGIAGTFNAANLAKEELLETYPDFDLTIIDSRCASIGFGLVVYKAALMLKEHADKQVIIDAIEYHCRHMEHIFTVDTLDYLFKGGRLSRSSFVAGGLLDIKPIIKMDEKGSLISVEKVRGRQKSIKRLIELVGTNGDALNSQVIGLCHGDDIKTLNQVKEMLHSKYGCESFIETYVGCAIGAHTGPGIIGITYLDKKSPYDVY